MRVQLARIAQKLSVPQLPVLLELGVTVMGWRASMSVPIVRLAIIALVEAQHLRPATQAVFARKALLRRVHFRVQLECIDLFLEVDT